MGTPDAIRATINEYVARMSANDRAAWLELFAPDAWIEDPVGTDPHRGREAIGGFWDFTHTLADSIVLRATGPARVAAGEAAFPMQAISELGEERFVVDIIDVMTFDDDARITTMRAFWDPAEMRPFTD